MPQFIVLRLLLIRALALPIQVLYTYQHVVPATLCNMVCACMLIQNMQDCRIFVAS